MTNDPLQRLRHQLVDAANRQAAAGAQPTRRTRRATWLAVGLAAIAVPAGAAAGAATGIIDLGSGSTPDGGSYTVTRSDDDRASSDPTRSDGIGRTCENTTFRDKNGTLSTFIQGCRPRGTELPGTVLSPGFAVTPGGGLLINGTARNDVAKVTISGVDQPIKLTKDPHDDLQRFDALTTQEPHAITAYDADGRLLERTTVGFG